MNDVIDVILSDLCPSLSCLPFSFRNEKHSGRRDDASLEHLRECAECDSGGHEKTAEWGKSSESMLYAVQ